MITASAFRPSARTVVVRARWRRCRRQAAALLVLALVSPLGVQPSSRAAAPDDVEAPVTAPVGTYGGIEYVVHSGVFRGETSTGAFRVPYQITAPADPAQANGAVVVEPAHFAIGAGARDFHLGPDLLFGNGFVHVAVGWSDVDNRILDPSVPGTFVNGGSRQYGGHSDPEIAADLARALTHDPDVSVLIGEVAHTYLVGFSDTADAVLGLVETGIARGVFDVVFAITIEKHDPQRAIRRGLFDGRVVAVNSEAEKTGQLADDGSAREQYRFYVVAGAPHIVDDGSTPLAAGTTPADFQPEVRARFLQAHAWAIQDVPPPPSTRFAALGSRLLRDAAGNAMVVEVDGSPAPRLPYVELGEARFSSGFIGRIDAVRSLGSLGFADHTAYLVAFDAAVDAQLAAGHLLEADAELMRTRARLCAPLTFTETYRDRYEQFVAGESC